MAVLNLFNSISVTVKSLINAHALINAHPLNLDLKNGLVFGQFLEKYQPLINVHWRILVEEVSESLIWNDNGKEMCVTSGMAVAS